MNEKETKDYLDYYIHLPNPDFAVMITGKWGTGKTLFIHKYIQGTLGDYEIEQKKLYKEMEDFFIEQHDNYIRSKIAAQKQEEGKQEDDSHTGIKEIEKKEEKGMEVNTKQCQKERNKKNAICVSLYGVKSEGEIDNQVWVQILKKKSFLLTILAVTILFVTAIAFGIKWCIPKTEMLVRILFHSLGILAITILTWYYKTLKVRCFSLFLTSTEFLVFDDFERACVPYESLLGYLNRYIEQLHKHVVIICNEDEVENKEKQAKHLSNQSNNEPIINDVDATNNNERIIPPSSSFRRMKEKVIGKTILFEQSDEIAMQLLLKQSNFPILRYLSNKDMFFSCSIVRSTKPLGQPVNFRVWLLCCREFERVFNGISFSYFERSDVVHEFIPRFFALFYSLQIHDFGNNHFFTTDTALAIFVDRSFDEQYKWFYTYFPIYYSSAIFPASIWKDIIFGKTIDPVKIITHWDALSDTKKEDSFEDQPVWLKIMRYMVNTDKENKIAWRELKKAYLSRSIQNPANIISTYSSVDDMIRYKMCPQTKLTRNTLLKFALKYIQSVKIVPESDLEKYLDSIFNRLDLDGHPRVKSRYFIVFQKQFQKRLREHINTVIVSKRFNSLLSNLSSQFWFDYNWSSKGLKNQVIFQKQSPVELMNHLICLHPSVLFYRCEAITQHIFDLRKENTYYLDFEQHFLGELNRLLLNDNIKHIDKSTLFLLRRMQLKIKKDLNKPSTSTDREPEQ